MLLCITSGTNCADFNSIIGSLVIQNKRCIKIISDFIEYPETVNSAQQIISTNGRKAKQVYIP
jgi:phosphoribosylpyrophosphate synthetase